MTVRRPASRFSPRPWRMSGGRGVLAAILVAGAGANALARPAFERHEAVETQRHEAVETRG